MAESRGVLSPPDVPRVRYPRNFIKTAVCEVRFPTLLELEEKAPQKLQAKLRKDFPFYEQQIVEIGGDGPSREHRYLFRSKDKHWTVAVKSFALSMETSKYVDFDDFFSRLKKVFDHAQSMIDADFFTRVGLRYINFVPIEDGKVKDWIRNDLIAPITGGVLGDAEKYVGIIHGDMKHGKFTMRHGLRDDVGALNKSDATPTASTPVASQHYQLDFDYYAENVELGDVEGCIKKFNATNFALFSWCLGDKSKALLGEGRPKK